MFKQILLILIGTVFLAESERVMKIPIQFGGALVNHKGKYVPYDKHWSNLKSKEYLIVKDIMQVWCDQVVNELPMFKSRVDSCELVRIIKMRKTAIALMQFNLIRGHQGIDSNACPSLTLMDSLSEGFAKTSKTTKHMLRDLNDIGVTTKKKRKEWKFFMGGNLANNKGKLIHWNQKYREHKYMLEIEKGLETWINHATRDSFVDDVQLAHVKQQGNFVDIKLDIDATIPVYKRFFKSRCLTHTEGTWFNNTLQYYAAKEGFKLANITIY